MIHNQSIFRVKDHAVSGESFELHENSQYGYLETTPQPNDDVLGDYYNSVDYISHTDSSRNFFEKCYQFVRKIALRKKITLINSLPLEGRCILDIGCGTGDFLQLANKHNWRINGVEPNIDARAIANKKTNNAVHHIAQLDYYSAQCFDVITLWHVLEHVPDLNSYISRLHELLKDNGRLIVAVPNYKSYDAFYYKSFWAGFDVPRHLWHFDQNSMSNLFNKNNMHLEAIAPMRFDAFYVSLLSEKYKTGKMNYLRALYVGLLSNLKANRTKEFSSLIYTIKKA